METLKEKTAKGLLWGGMSTGLQQVLSLVFGIVLARKLSQADYGLVGMLAIFSAIAACMQEGGFIAALNRKKEVTQRDYNAVFWTSVGVSVFFYLLFSLPHHSLPTSTVSRDSRLWPAILSSVFSLLASALPLVRTSLGI